MATGTETGNTAFRIPEDMPNLSDALIFVYFGNCFRVHFFCDLFTVVLHLAATR